MCSPVSYASDATPPKRQWTRARAAAACARWHGTRDRVCGDAGRRRHGGTRDGTMRISVSGPVLIALGPIPHDNVAPSPTPLDSNPNPASSTTPAPLRMDENLMGCVASRRQQRHLMDPKKNDISVPDSFHAAHQKNLKATRERPTRQGIDPSTKTVPSSTPPLQHDSDADFWTSSDVPDVPYPPSLIVTLDTMIPMIPMGTRLSSESSEPPAARSDHHWHIDDFFHSLSFFLARRCPVRNHEVFLF
ncbi:hypothetical protein EDB83DRAFT_2318832 [Lactarius deliciosus]|nr:hypothetical protein EDB83DRAFT_2318832 [Lactarius deliciosus]